MSEYLLRKLETEYNNTLWDMSFEMSNVYQFSLAIRGMLLEQVESEVMVNTLSYGVMRSVIQQADIESVARIYRDNFKSLEGVTPRNVEFFEEEEEETEEEKEPINITVSQSRFYAMVKLLQERGKNYERGLGYGFYTFGNEDYAIFEYFIGKYDANGDAIIYWNLDKHTKQE